MKTVSTKINLGSFLLLFLKFVLKNRPDLKLEKCLAGFCVFEFLWKMPPIYPTCFIEAKVG